MKNAEMIEIRKNDEVASGVMRQAGRLRYGSQDGCVT